VWFLEIFAYFHDKVFRYYEKVRMGIECADKETEFRNGIKEIYDTIFCMNKISALWMLSGT